METSAMDEIYQLNQTEPNEILSHGESDSLHQITEGSKQLLKAVVDGQLHEVQEILECKRPEVDINCTDTLGKTPLILAAERGQFNKQMVQLLVENGADIEGALLHAVTQENTKTPQMPLNYNSNKRKKPSIETNSTFLSSVSPLMLACKLCNFEMVKLLMAHGEQVIEHNIDCSCDTCVSAESSLSRELNRLESYKALSSPVYIAAKYIVNPEATGGPIYRAFALSKKLRKLANINYEFKDDYQALIKDSTPLLLIFSTSVWDWKKHR